MFQSWEDLHTHNTRSVKPDNFYVKKINKSERQRSLAYSGTVACDLLLEILTLFDMGGGMMAPQNVFNHCAQTLRRRKLEFGDF